MLNPNSLFDNITYNDTPFLINGLKDKLKITTICDVREPELKNYLLAIVASNPFAKFYVVQYSKETQKLYIFADKVIILGEITNLNYIVKKEPDIKSEISTSIENAFQTNDNNNPDHVSLYEIAELTREYYATYQEARYKGSELLKEKLNRHRDIFIRDFDYEKEELIVKLGITFIFDKTIKFTKKNNDLCLADSLPLHYDDSKELLIKAGEELSAIYDELKGFTAFFNEASNDIKSVNSNFYIDINCKGVKLSIPSLDPNEKKRINILSSTTSKKYNYHYNSNDIISLTRDNEEELFKKIFIKIEDCPKWSQELLTISRQNELLSQSRKIEQNKKMIKLKERIFPWTKK